MRPNYWIAVLAAALPPLAAAAPEDDIVAVTASRPLETAEAPSLTRGLPVLEDLEQALEAIRERYPLTARTLLDDAEERLAPLAAGTPQAEWRPAGGDGRWVAAGAVAERVDLDLPEPGPRPPPRELVPSGRQASSDALTGTLQAVADRVRVFPVEAMREAVAEARRATGDAPDWRAAEEALVSAQDAVREVVRLRDRPLLLAYYRTADALTLSPGQPLAARRTLRQAAEALYESGTHPTLAEALQSAADAPVDRQALLRLLARLRSAYVSGQRQVLGTLFPVAGEGRGP
jgi:hypothetical protein